MIGLARSRRRGSMRRHLNLLRLSPGHTSQQMNAIPSSRLRTMKGSGMYLRHGYLYHLMLEQSIISRCWEYTVALGVPCPK